jgi:single-strand DNA-binding protein
MSNLNTVTIVGRTGRDPEIRYLQSGTQVAAFSLAVDGWSKDDAEPVTHWIDVKVWGKPAQVCADYLRKGQMVGLSGRLEQERWTSKTGENRSRVVIVASTVQLLTPKAKADPQPMNEPEDLPF